MKKGLHKILVNFGGSMSDLIRIKPVITNIRRILTRNILFSTVNIIGLVIGISAFIIISIRVYNAISYEDFNPKAGVTYRVLTEPAGEQTSILSICKLSEELSRYPQVTQSCRITPYFMNLAIQKEDVNFKESRIIAADTNFFTFFSYKMIIGDVRSVLKGPDKIVFTQEMSKKYFGSGNPVGRTITVMFGNTTRQMEVTGVCASLPSKTNLSFDFVISNIEGNGKFKKDDPWLNWELLNWITYVQLAPDVKASNFESLISDHLVKVNPSSKYHLHLQTLKRIHLYSGDLVNADILTTPGNIRHLRIMVVIAVLILFTSFLNFTILTCADSMSRRREIIIRKILGSSQRTLIRKFFFEMSAYIIIALCISLIIIPLIINSLGEFSGQEFKFAGIDIRLVISLLLVLSAVNLLTGSYPAFLLTNKKSLSALPFGKNPAKNRLPLLKPLLVSQLTVSLILIFSTIVLTRQIKLIRNFNLGFDTENIVYFPCDEMPYDYRTGISVVSNALMKIPFVSYVTCGSELPLSINYYMDESDWDGKTAENKTRFHYLKAEHDFLKTLNIKLLEGRDFSRETVSDDSAFLVNAAAARVMDIENPLGKNFTYIFRGTDRITGKIIGITDNFHFNTLYNETEPLVIGIQVGKPHYIFVRVRPGSGTNSISEIRLALKKIYPDINPEMNFLSQAFTRQYIQEIQTGRVFSIFCIIALLITMLGLFGQSAFTIKKRSLELCIRRINGATVSEIMRMLSREYILLLAVAFIVASPLAYFAMNGWLEDFAIKIRITISVFLETALTGILMLYIAILWQLYLHATKNVIETIRMS